jgi:hypothetical protein
MKSTFRHLPFPEAGDFSWQLQKAAPKGGEGAAAGLQPPPNPQNRNLKNKDVLDIIISKVLRDLPFSRNRPRQSADD